MIDMLDRVTTSYYCFCTKTKINGVTKIILFCNRKEKRYVDFNNSLRFLRFCELEKL